MSLFHTHKLSDGALTEAQLKQEHARRYKRFTYQLVGSAFVTLISFIGCWFFPVLSLVTMAGFFGTMAVAVGNGNPLAICQDITEERHCARLLELLQASPEGQAYRQAVLNQGRKFVKGELAMAESWLDAQKRTAALVQLYVENKEPSKFVRTGKPLSWMYPLKSSLSSPDTIRAGAPTAGQIRAEGLSAMRLQVASLLLIFLTILSYFHVAATSIASNVDGNVTLKLLCHLVVICGGLTLFVSLSNRKYGALRSADAMHRLYLAYEKTPEGRAYRQMVVAQGREFVGEELRAILAWNAKVELESARNCKQLYDIAVES